jgi:YggT family protein
MGLIMQAVFVLIQLLKAALVIRVILSFLPISADNPLVRMLYSVTEPVLAPIRRLLERSSIGGNMMMDFSPIIAFLLIGLIQSILF